MSTNANAPGQGGIGETLARTLASVLELFTGQGARVRVQAADPPHGHSPECFAGAGAVQGHLCFWINDELCRALLADSSDDEETIRGTVREILSQTASGLGEYLTREAGAEAVLSPGGRTALPADDGVHFALHVERTDSPGVVLPVQSTLVVPAMRTTGSAPVHCFGNSPALDSMLDVEMPVSVSFGRAQLPIKDVLRLSSGSVIELQRCVSEPVDLVVNGRVIATGDVVVVDGNYGIRIQQIMSTQERMSNLR